MRIGRRTRQALLAALFSAAGLPPEAGAQVPDAGDILEAQLTEAVRIRVEAGLATGQWRVAGRRLHARSALPDVYLRRVFRPVWIRGDGLTPDVGVLLAAVRTSSLQGLEPADYHRAALDSLLDHVGDDVEGATADRLMQLELLLTDAFLALGSHLLRGRVEPEALDAEWLADWPGADLAVVLLDALEGEGDVGAALAAVRPPQPEYASLVNALARLRSQEADGGWEVVERGSTLRLGDRDPRVPAVRRRMAVMDDLPVTADPEADPTVFDQALEQGVRRFQGRHGLEADGVVGARTLEAMNVPVEARIRQILVNLERWRWLPRDLGRRHVRVNIAAYHVDLYEDGLPAMHMRAIVGRPYRQTPVFSDQMRYLVLAPYWHVPPTIAAVDKLPLIKADPGSLAAQRFVLFDAATNGQVDPRTVDWASVTGTEFNRRFRLRQDPGPLNALGRVKFMFPNKYNVYLHDTPTRELFAVAQRDFSSGCIRLERPLELAERLLRHDPQWTPERIRDVIAEGREHTVPLPEPVPVHLLYFTAFLDGDERIHLRPDVYQRDNRVLRALQAAPPGTVRPGAS